MLAAFRSVLTQARPFAAQQPIRSMAVKATAASATTKPKAKKTETAKAPKKTVKAKAPAKAKKAVPAVKPKPQRTPVIDLPKRPSTSWSLFFVEHMEKVRNSGKKVVPTAEGVVASGIWKSMSDAEKKVYTDRYRAERQAYEKNISARLQELTPAEFKLENSRRQALRALGKKGLPSLKDPNAPKRPLSSYFLYANEQRAAGKFAHLPVKEQAKAFANAWKEVPEQEKTRLTGQFKVAQEAYKVEKAAYDARH
ncbi:hypothetical protein EMPS_01765 [Entomortierella parvispora]|uniref:HMG box domain-containing protein n=1 Tax=Entomortierella parvispora TaxID=205924 RepID=A0A9P3H3H3_9FUNG|nr:hypothetical protein EMPS_01765 [Entomortierella parvispora]